MIMVGTNLDYSNNTLVSLINDYSLKDNIILLGDEMIYQCCYKRPIYRLSSLGKFF